MVKRKVTEEFVISISILIIILLCVSFVSSSIVDGCDELNDDTLSNIFDLVSNT